jgi:MYXO-CTERM domain-containing protein
MTNWGAFVCRSVPNRAPKRGYATRHVVALGSIAVAWVVAWSPSASACSMPWPPPALDGYPADGATGVPTDVVPVYESIQLGDPALGGPIPFVLRDAQGTQIPLVMSAPYTWYVALTPRTELEPNTTYTLEASVTSRGTPTSIVVVTASFTTGDGPASSPEPTNGALLEHFTAHGAVSSCDATPQGTCVALPPEAFVTASFVDEFGQEHPPDLYRGPTFTNLSGVNQGTNFRCVRLRSRAPNGAESAPVELCGDGAPFYDYDGSSNAVACTPAGLTFGGKTPEDASGVSRHGAGDSCSVQRGPARPSPAWLTLLGLAGLAMKRRRRRSRPAGR